MNSSVFSVVPGAEPARSYRLERQVQIANCENRGYAVAEGVHYADERGSVLGHVVMLDPEGNEFCVA